MSRCIAEWPDDVRCRQPLDSYTAFAALTHDPKIDDLALKPALDARLLLCRRARQPQDPCATRSSACWRQGIGAGGARPHSCADRPRHWRDQPGRNRRIDHRRDNRRPEA